MEAPLHCRAGSPFVLTWSPFFPGLEEVPFPWRQDYLIHYDLRSNYYLHWTPNLTHQPFTSYRRFIAWFVASLPFAISARPKSGVNAGSKAIMPGKLLGLPSLLLCSYYQSLSNLVLIMKSFYVHADTIWFLKAGLGMDVHLKNGSSRGCLPCGWMYSTPPLANPPSGKLWYTTRHISKIALVNP